MPADIVDQKSTALLFVQLYPYFIIVYPENYLTLSWDAMLRDMCTRLRIFLISARTIFNQAISRNHLKKTVGRSGSQPAEIKQFD